jgi:hypothetical protein
VNSLSISIGGLVTNIQCANTMVIKLLHRNYQVFQTETDPAMVVRLVISRQFTGKPPAEKTIIFEKGDVRFDLSNFEGSVSLPCGQAELTIGPMASVGDVEYFIRIIYALLAYDAGGFLFHSAGVIHNHKASLFFGPSGSGKTTIAKNSPPDKVINDDLVILRPMPESNHAWRVFSTPFSHPDQVKPNPLSAPVGAIFRLVKDKQVFIRPIQRAQAVAEVVSNIPVLTGDPARARVLMERSFNLLQNAPAWWLHFLPDDTFWPVVGSDRVYEYE